jgi:hypothetical protein
VKGENSTGEACGHQLSGTDDRRGETVIESYLTLELRGRHGLRHPPGLSHIKCQWLLNVNVLAGHNSSQHCAFMRVVGHTDVNDVHIIAGEQRAIIVCPNFAADLSRRPFRCFSVFRCHTDDPNQVGG